MSGLGGMLPTDPRKRRMVLAAGAGALLALVVLIRRRGASSSSTPAATSTSSTPLVGSDTASLGTLSGTAGSGTSNGDLADLFTQILNGQAAAASGTTPAGVATNPVTINIGTPITSADPQLPAQPTFAPPAAVVPTPYTPAPVVAPAPALPVNQQPQAGPAVPASTGLQSSAAYLPTKTVAKDSAKGKVHAA